MLVLNECHPPFDAKTSVRIVWPGLDGMAQIPPPGSFRKWLLQLRASPWCDCPSSQSRKLRLKSSPPSALPTLSKASHYPLQGKTRDGRSCVWGGTPGDVYQTWRVPGGMAV